MLEYVCRVFISITKIPVPLLAMEILEKSLSHSAAERDEELRTLWELRITRPNGPDSFVFLDESAMYNKPFRGLKLVSCWWSFGTLAIV